MKRNYLIPTPDWTSKTSVLTAACRVCGLSLGELRERLKKQTLCEVAAELLRKVSALPVSVERFEYWQPNNDPVTDALLRSLFIEANPLRSARRSSGLNVTEFAKMLGISRQRLHVLERAHGGEALLRACARAEKHADQSLWDREAPEREALLASVQNLEQEPARFATVLERLRRGGYAVPTSSDPGLWDICTQEDVIRCTTPDDYCTTSLINRLKADGLVRVSNSGKGIVWGEFLPIVPIIRSVETTAS